MTVLGPVEGVLFDVDDTLVDTRGAFVHGLAAVAAEYLPPAAADSVPEMLRLWREDSGGFYRAYTRGELGFVIRQIRHLVHHGVGSERRHGLTELVRLEDVAHDRGRAEPT